MPDKIAVIGLGYVGLPLAVAFGKQYSVLGFDIKSSRIEELYAGIDHTNETNLPELSNVLRNWTNSDGAVGLCLSSIPITLSSCNIYIVTVPTPIDQSKLPDLSSLKRATEMIGKVLKKGDLVIYESTVYPGCTEEVCVPLLKNLQALFIIRNFFVGILPNG